MRLPFVALVALSFCLTAFAVPQPPPLDPPPALPGPAGFPQSAVQQFKELIPSLVEALKDSDAEVRQNSALALAVLGSDALVPLKDALKDANKEKRAAAAYALGQMGYTGREAMNELLKAMKDDESAVRRSASQAVSRILAAEGNFPGFPGQRTTVGGNPIPAPSGPPSLPTPGLTPAVGDKK